jgi:hypothetical protein
MFTGLHTCIYEYNVYGDKYICTNTYICLHGYIHAYTNTYVHSNKYMRKHVGMFTGLKFPLNTWRQRHFVSKCVFIRTYVYIHEQR